MRCLTVGAFNAWQLKQQCLPPIQGVNLLGPTLILICFVLPVVDALPAYILQHIAAGRAADASAPLAMEELDGIVVRELGPLRCGARLIYHYTMYVYIGYSRCAA